MAAEGERVRVSVGGPTLTVTSLTKVLYPATGTTKAEVLDYVTKVSDHLLAEMADRPVTRKRWVHGTGDAAFFEKNASSGTPSWVRTVRLPTPGSSKNREHITFPIIDSLASLIWHVNLNSLELHTPQWKVGARGAMRNPDRMVVDLDPGPGTGLEECAEVALLVRERLDHDSLRPVTSGSKGMQLYMDLPGRADADAVRERARQLAEGLAKDHPKLVVAVMTKSRRPGRIFLDWSQNSASKTTITPWSLRGREQPTVAVPRTWDEVEDGANLHQLRYDEVLGRLGV